MVHSFTHEGAHWQAEVTGTQDAAGLRRAGVWFRHQSTGIRLLGGLNPVDAARPTDAHLGDALAVVLQKLREIPPALHAVRLKTGEAGFMIDHEMYSGVGRDEISPQSGYLNTPYQLLLDEAATRRDLKTFFGLSDHAIDERIAQAKDSSIQAKWTRR